MLNPERAYKDVVKVLRSLEAAGYSARLAGGCVRDRLLGLTPADYDVATDALPDVVLQHFRTEERSTIPTGIDHGTITVVMPSGPVEVTTLRKDVETDGRHAQVAFGTSFQDDAERRDFTINAMFEDADGRVYDDVGGQEDLKAGVLRFVGAAQERIKEDYLRILRLFRFWAKLGFVPVAGTLEAVAAEREGLSRVSQERITTEMLQLLGAPHSHDALVAMCSTGVWQVVLPELQAAAGLPDASVMQIWHDRLAPSHRSVAILGGICLRFAHLNAAELLQLAERLRLSNLDGKRLAFFVQGAELLKMSAFKQTADLLDVVDRCEHAGGADAWTQVYAPIWSGDAGLKAVTLAVDVAELKHGHLRRAKLPLSGRDLSKALGMAAGPEMGHMLEALKRSYRNGEWRSAEEGLEAARALLGKGV